MSIRLRIQNKKKTRLSGKTWNFAAVLPLRQKTGSLLTGCRQ
jgi:hypothetical protein